MMMTGMIRQSEDEFWVGKSVRRPQAIFQASGNLGVYGSIQIGYLN